MFGLLLDKFLLLLDIDLTRLVVRCIYNEIHLLTLGTCMRERELQIAVQLP